MSNVLRLLFVRITNYIFTSWWPYIRVMIKIVTQENSYIFCVALPFLCRDSALVCNVHESHLLLFLYLPTNSYDTHYDNNFLCSLAFSSPRFSFSCMKRYKVVLKINMPFEKHFPRQINLDDIWFIKNKWFFYSWK